MFAPIEPWWSFVVRTLVVYLALTLGLRLFGRRELGLMTPFDLVVIRSSPMPCRTPWSARTHPLSEV